LGLERKAQITVGTYYGGGCDEKGNMTKLLERGGEVESKATSPEVLPTMGRRISVGGRDGSNSRKKWLSVSQV